MLIRIVVAIQAVAILGLLYMQSVNNQVFRTLVDIDTLHSQGITNLAQASQSTTEHLTTLTRHVGLAPTPVTYPQCEGDWRYDLCPDVCGICSNTRPTP